MHKMFDILILYSVLCKWQQQKVVLIEYSLLNTPVHASDICLVYQW